MKPLRVVAICIVAVAAILFSLAYIDYHNEIASMQRESIRYCDIDQDCAIYSYYLVPCGEWAACFNKNERPMGDIGAQSALCDFPPASCKCENGTCVGAMLGS